MKLCKPPLFPTGMVYTMGDLVKSYQLVFIQMVGLVVAKNNDVYKSTIPFFYLFSYQTNHTF